MATKIIYIRDIKGRWILRDLKIIRNIPSSIPHIEEGYVILPASLKKLQELQTHTENVQNPEIS